MRVIKFYIIVSVLMVAVFLPKDGALQASANGQLTGYWAYPKPFSKSLVCKIESVNHENISQKQAAVAALGLYLGVKKAAAPSSLRGTGMPKRTCA